MPIAEITQAETAERARLLCLGSYDVELDLTGGPEVFRSASLVRFDCAEPGESSYIDLVAETVHEITLNGVSIDVATFADGRIPLAGLAARNELRVVADCGYSHEGAGLHRSVDSADGKVYLYTELEPAGARRVFACFEQPDLKAAFAFRVMVPAHWTVLSNSAAAEPEPAGPSAAVWTFPPTPRIPTYVTAVVAGDYHVVRQSHTTATGQVIPIGLACRSSLADHLDHADIFAVTRQGLDFYVGLFGTEFPFAKYDQIFVPELGIGGAENAGCVTLAEQFLFRSKVTDQLYEMRALVILHEMAHMWFGDLVTMRWWNDLWLNESFADFCAVLVGSEGTRFTDAWTTFANVRKTWGYRQDQMATTHPVSANVPTLAEAISNFDGISYAKGASVLKQLVAYVGRDSFFTGIRAYFAEHAWSNATLSDLLTALETSSGRALADWSKVWLETAGVNTLHADFEVGPDGTFSSFAVLQEAPPSHPTLRPHHIAIGLYHRADGALTRTGRFEVDVDGARTGVPELVGVAQPDLILLNDDDLGYVLVSFDSRSQATLTHSIGEFTESLPRAVCWLAAVDMVQQARMSVPVLTAMLCSGMSAEPSVSVLHALHMAAQRIFDSLGDPAWVPAGKRELATTAVTLLRAAEPGGDHQLAWVQLLGWTAITGDQLDLVAGLLDGSTEIDGLTVDTELRWTLLARLAATGRAGDAEVDAELARDATDDGQRHAAICRAAMPDAEHKAAAWALLTQTEELDFQRATEVAASFAQPEHVELLTPYADQYLEILPVIWESRNELLRMILGQLLLPYPAASAELLRRLDAFLAVPGRDPGLTRVVAERRDVIERALRSRALTG